MQASFAHSVALYLDSVSLNLFDKYSTGCQIFPCCYSKTAPAAVPDASDLTPTGNSGLYTLRTRIDVKANFSASKSVCYSAPNLKDFLPCKISKRGAAILANP